MDLIINLVYREFNFFNFVFVKTNKILLILMKVGANALKNKLKFEDR